MTDVRVTEVLLEVAETPVAAAVRATSVLLEVAMPRVPDVFSLAAPAFVQVAWDTSVTDRWYQPYVNGLIDGSLGVCLTGIELIQQSTWLRSPNVKLDTLTLDFDDPDGVLIPGKATSPLYPHVAPGAWVRVLTLDGGTVIPQFVGLLTEITPPDARTRQGQLRVESPLRRYQNLSVTVPTVNGYTCNTVTPSLSAVHALFTAAGVPYTIDAGVYASLPGPWGGESVTFGAALSGLAYRAGALVHILPQYATTVGGDDYVFRWRDPNLELPDTVAPYFALDANATPGDLVGPQDVSFGSGEVP